MCPGSASSTGSRFTCTSPTTPPPHIHAQYGGVEAVIAIGDGAVIRGSIPDRALRLVREWLELHREEVEANWRLAATPGPLNAIDPLP